MSAENPTLRRRRAARRMWVVAVLTASLALRMYHLGTAPRPVATADEFHYVWAGLSLWTHGTPTAWSDLEAYQGTDHYLGQVQMLDIQPNIVAPALDHPPLYSLLAGGFAWLTGARPYLVTTTLGKRVELWEFDLGRARLLSLIFYSVSFFLLYDLAARRFGFGAAFVALILYGSIDHMVIHDRLLVTESLSTPLFLANLCAFERLRTGRWSEGKFGVVTVLLCAAALLTKLVAACQAGAVLILILSARRFRAAIYPIAGLGLGLAIYMGYAAWQGWGFFWQVMFSQGMRFIGFNALQSMIAHPLLVHTPFFDPPIFIGWLALFIGAAGMRGGRGRELFIAPLVFFLQYVFFSDALRIFGWHLIPFHPFLALALGALFMQVWRRRDPLLSLALAALLLPVAFGALYVADPDAATQLRLIYAGTGGLAILLPYVREPLAERAHRLLLALLLICIVAGEASSVKMDSPNLRVYPSENARGTANVAPEAK